MTDDLRADDCWPLPRAFYDGDTVKTARELLGKLLLRRTAEGLAGGRIVEVEAYLPRDDSANHAARGRTRRNASMFGPPGQAYVYAIHSRWCLNAVTEPEGVASAVLIRAIEPLLGIELMRKRRVARARADRQRGQRRHRSLGIRGEHEPLTAAVLRDLARGPARLCEALAIDGTLNGWDLTIGGRLWIARPPDPPVDPVSIGRSRRVGVTLAHELPLRFFIEDCPFVSRPGLRE
jgi:DNA-3-methyladenine glycosylase